MSKKHFLTNFAGSMSRAREEHLTKIGGRAEAECVADLLDRAVGGGQKLNGTVAQQDLALRVGRDAKHMAKGIVNGRFADTAMAGNVGNRYIRMLCHVMCRFVA